MLNHASSSIYNFNKAIELEPGNSLYHLSLASVSKEFLAWKFSLDNIDDNLHLALYDNLKNGSFKNTQERVYHAFELSYEEELTKAEKTGNRAYLGRIISLEAGRLFEIWGQWDTHKGKKATKTHKRT